MHELRGYPLAGDNIIKIPKICFDQIPKKSYLCNHAKIPGNAIGSLVEWMMKHLAWGLLVFVLIVNRVWAQPQRTGTISGFVHDAANGESLIGANVFLQGTQRGSSTNAHGYFVITNLPAGKYTLVCRYIGYRVFSRELAVGPGENVRLNISLQEQPIQAQELVIVADSARTAQQLFQRPISDIELAPREINQIPQIAESDLLRSLQTLPGIVPVSDFSSALYIRGGTADQNLYLLDGTDVYNPEHMFGLFSTFNTDAIKSVEVSKGGFGAQYGGRLSSIINVINLDGNRKHFEGKGSVSLLSAKLSLQMPIGRIGSLSISGRRTYFDQTVARVIKDIPNYYFFDGNAKAYFELSPKDRLTISAYGGRDYLDFVFNKNAADQADFLYDWGNTTGSVRWTRVFNPKLFANFWLTGSRFSSNFDFSQEADITEYNFISDITLKGNLTYYAAQNLNLDFGFEQKNLHGVYRQSFPGGRVDISLAPREIATYLQASWQPNVRWNIDAGLRYTLFQTDARFSRLAPRLALKYRLTDTINLKAATGVYHQFMQQIPRLFFVDIWTTADQYNPSSRAKHFIFGIQKELSQYFSLELETYHKTYHNLHSFKQFITDISADEFDPNGKPVYTKAKGLFDRGDGFSQGVEVLVRKNAGAATGWLGLAVARTQWKVDGVNRNNPYPPRHDRMVVANFTANVDLRNAWRGLRGKSTRGRRGSWFFGVNFVYASGQPFTVPGSAYKVSTFPDFNKAILLPGTRVVDFLIYPTDINSFRLPYYARLDLSLKYEKHFRTWSLMPFIQVFNIGNRKNVWFIQYKDESTEDKIVQKADTIDMLPLLPTIGVNFKF